MVRTRLRAAMAACGGIAALTLDAARRSPDFSVTAIQDVDPEALERVGERYAIGRRHQRFASLLTDDVDFVIVNSPNHHHLPQVLAAVAAGKPCLVQKPMARTPEEAERMIEAAARAGVRLGVTMFERGKPLNHEVRSMIRAGWLGDPVVFQAVAAHDLYLETPPPADDWRRDATRVGGGAFQQLGIHFVDLARFLLDAEPVSVSALSALGHTVFEDETTLATIRMRSGVLAHVAASYATSDWSYAVLGTRGRVQVTAEHVTLAGKAPWRGRLLAYETPGPEIVVPRAAFATAEEAIAPEVEVHGAFARWIRDGEPFASTGEEGRLGLRVSAAVQRAREEGTCVSLA